MWRSRLIKVALPVTLLPLSYFIGPAHANTAYGYGVQWCNMVRSGMDPEESGQIVTNAIRNGVPPYQDPNPFQNYSWNSSISSGISSGIIDAMQQAARLNEMKPGFQATIKSECPDYVRSFANYKQEQSIEKKICWKEEEEIGPRRKTVKRCRPKTNEELAVDAPPKMPLEMPAKYEFCKVNRYRDTCKNWIINHEKTVQADIENSPKKVIVVEKTIEEKLEEAQELLNEKKITPEEYSLMRKNILGLN